MTDFIIVGNGNAVTCKEIFPLIKENKMWLGNKAFSGGMDMLAGKNYDATKCKHPKYDERGNLLINVMMCVWFTNVDHKKRNTPITLYKTYSADKYPKYDNYDAIEVDNVNRIPCDYDGVMGVPITFLDKYCPSQFELIGIDSTDFAEKIGIKPMGEEFIRRYRANGGTGHYTEGMRNLCYYENDGTPKKVYSRILIKKKVSNKKTKFIIIGNGNALTTKEIFPLIKENKMWLGAGKGMGGKAMEFIVDASIYDASKGSVNRIENGKCYVGVMMCTWFTNIDHTKRNTPLGLYKAYSPEKYPKYDNYDAIEVSRVENIPMDYDGIMGVPISFLDKYCPSQFEIVKFRKGDDDKDLSVNGKCPYFRILIRRKLS